MKIVSLVKEFAANPAVQRAPDALELLQDSVGGALVHEAAVACACIYVYTRARARHRATNSASAHERPLDKLYYRLGTAWPSKGQWKNTP